MSRMFRSKGTEHGPYPAEETVFCSYSGDDGVLGYSSAIVESLTMENQTVGVEPLKIKNMVKNWRLSKRISDVTRGKFLNMTEYKLKERAGALSR